MQKWLVFALLCCAPGCSGLTGTPITLPPVTIPPINIPPITIPLTSSPAPAVALCAQPAAMMQVAPAPVPVQVVQELHNRLELAWLDMRFPYLRVGQSIETPVTSQVVLQPHYVAAQPQVAQPLVCVPQQAYPQTAPPPLAQPQVAQPTNAELCNRLSIAEDALKQLKQAAGCAPK